MYFDPDTLLPLCTDASSNGRLYHVTGYQNIKIDVPIDPARFQWTPPPGKKPIDKDSVD